MLHDGSCKTLTGDFVAVVAMMVCWRYICMAGSLNVSSLVSVGGGNGDNH